MTIHATHWQFTVTDYARMREAGILTEDDRVELIDGEVYHMSPIGPLHVAIVNRLNSMCIQSLGTTAIVSVQNPIQLTDYTEPQPDIALLHPRIDFYADALPGPDDILLLIEVADSSLEYDRDIKLPRYAATGIAEVWIIDIESHQVTQYLQPYQTVRVYGVDDTIQSSSLPILTMAVANILL